MENECATMDCSICFETIDERTGSARLSCGHLYHFGCLARWVLKNQNCPYCRHQTNAYETIQEDSGTEDESELFDAESQTIEEPNLRWIRIGPGHWRVFDDAISQLPDFSEEDHALWAFRSLFGSLESSDPLPPAAPLVQKQEQQESQQRLLFRHRNIYDSSNDKGYESA
jgi:hypothetical protein